MTKGSNTSNHVGHFMHPNTESFYSQGVPGLTFALPLTHLDRSLSRNVAQEIGQVSL